MRNCENASLPNHIEFMNRGLVPTEDKNLVKKCDIDFCRLMMHALSGANWREKQSQVVARFEL